MNSAIPATITLFKRTVDDADRVCKARALHVKVVQQKFHHTRSHGPVQSQDNRSNSGDASRGSRERFNGGRGGQGRGNSGNGGRNYGGRGNGNQGRGAGGISSAYQSDDSLLPPEPLDYEAGFGGHIALRLCGAPTPVPVVASATPTLDDSATASAAAARPSKRRPNNAESSLGDTGPSTPAASTPAPSAAASQTASPAKPFPRINRLLQTASVSGQAQVGKAAVTLSIA